LWLADVAGGNPALLTSSDPAPRTAAISWSGDFLFYSRRNLHRIRIDAAAAKLIGPPEQVTRGASQETHPKAVPFPSPSGWRIALASLATGQSRLYRLPLTKGGTGGRMEPEPLFSDGASRDTPSLSEDCSKLVYLRRGIEGFEIQSRDFVLGTERTLLRSKSGMRVRISPDGATVAYNPTANNEKETDIYLIAPNGGSPRKACDKCGMIYGWAPDSKRIIYRSGAPMRFWTFDTSTGSISEFLSHPKYHVHAARYSKDLKWMAFHLAPGDGPQHIFVAPVRDGKGPAESEWIPVYSKPGYNKRPWWSADGQTLYFISDSDGSDAIYTQRLDPATKRPLGEPAVLYRPEGKSAALAGGHLVGPGESEKFLIFPMRHVQANVWLAE